MSRIFITGAADGLGQMAAKLLVAEGHQVVLHARNKARANEALKAVPGAETALAADLSSIEETKALAQNVNSLGAFDAIIHNAGVGFREPLRNPTIDGLPEVFAVNSLSTYILTCLINRPKRLIYTGSGLRRHRQPRRRPQDAGLAGHQQRQGSPHHRKVLLPSITSRPPPRRRGHQDPGPLP